MKTSDSIINSCEPKNPANKGENERRETHAIALCGVRLVQMREKIKAAKGLPQLPAGPPENQACSRCRQWIAAWQTSETTMNIIVKSTARGESVVSIEKPNSQCASISYSTCQKYVGAR